MAKPILSYNQKLFLRVFSQEKSLTKAFYLTGGTALCQFYIPYRYSEDLDFFSEHEFNIEKMIVFLKKYKDQLAYNTIDINSTFNRNIIQIVYDTDILKTEFTFFPFPQIEKPAVHNGIAVDSLTDIAVNKLFTIYQSPRARDYIDLYMILKKIKNISIHSLILKAKAKFDWHVDPIKLGTQFYKAKEMKDYPKFTRKINHGEWQKFFLKEAKRLNNKIFS